MYSHEEMPVFSVQEGRDLENLHVQILALQRWRSKVLEKLFYYGKQSTEKLPAIFLEPLCCEKCLREWALLLLHLKQKWYGNKSYH